MIFPKRLSKIALFMTTSNYNYIFKPVEIDGIKIFYKITFTFYLSQPMCTQGIA